MLLGGFLLFSGPGGGGSGQNILSLFQGEVEIVMAIEATVETIIEAEVETIVTAEVETIIDAETCP